MARGKVLFKNPQEGDIKINPSNPSSTWIYTNGKWVYVKKRKPAKPKIVKTYNFPPVKIPPNMVETSFSGYYITREGDAYREPVKYERMPVNENGLVYLKPGLRGHKKYPEKQYFCVNITILDENGKKKQIKKSNHQLVAEAFVDNPNNYTEIMHMDDNPRNNYYTNLKWGTHEENMEGVISPCTTPKSYKITDTITGEIWEGMNMGKWVRNNYDMIIPRMRSKSQPTIKNINRHLSNARSRGFKIWGFIVEY
jgi:hypothetical protein|tara:strand:- start:50 stop:808 length:759 start_codon:yes stop_codon:yes gene_type:complete